MNLNRVNHKLRVRLFIEKNYAEDEFSGIKKEVMDFVKEKILYKACSCCCKKREPAQSPRDIEK